MNKNQRQFSDHTQFIPAHKINRSISNKIIALSWPKEVLHETETLDQSKYFYNKAFNLLRDKFDEIFKKCHPAAWALESFKQIEIWTIIHYTPGDKLKFKGPKDLTPIGRYGWRYVAEKAIENLNGEYKFNETKPNDEDLNDMFTVLAGMITSSEQSNYIHFLNSNLISSYIIFSPFTIEKDFHFRENEQNSNYKEIFSYLKSPGKGIHTPEAIALTNPELVNKINNFLKSNFGFDLSEADKFITALQRVCNHLKAGILVQPLEEAIEIISNAAILPRDTVKNFLHFISLDTKHPSYEPRDFLRKSQSIRLLNFCALIIELENNFEAIYDEESASLDSVKTFKEHLIISPTALNEWKDVFIFKLVLGQRSDLKLNKTFSDQLGQIERYYHEDIFEKQTKLICEKNGFYCILNLKRSNKKDLPCGEIDILAYNKTLNKLLLIECKALAPSVDARGIGKIVSDHFKQKNYHKKFLKKISWVNGNLQSINSIFKSQLNIEIEKKPNITPIFVTVFPNIVKYLSNNYLVMTYIEFEKWIENHE